MFMYLATYTIQPSHPSFTNAQNEVFSEEHIMLSFEAMRTAIKSTLWLLGFKLVLWTCLVGSATSATDFPALPVEKPSPRYAVAVEDLNVHCFTPSPYGSSNANGDFERNCHPGYRRGTRSKPCPRGKRCCPCEEWTYQPRFNLCEDCVARTYCPDKGKKFESYGNITTNSKCGEDIQIKSIPTEGFPTLAPATMEDDRDVHVTFQTAEPHGREHSIEHILIMWTAIGVIVIVLIFIISKKPLKNMMSKIKVLHTVYAASKRGSCRACSTPQQETQPPLALVPCESERFFKESPV